MKTQIQVIKELNVSHQTLVGLIKKCGIKPTLGYSKLTKDSKGRNHRVSALHFTDDDVAILKETIGSHYIVSTKEVLDMKHENDQKKQARERFNKSHQLNELGVSEKEISRITGVHTDVIKKYLSCKSYEEYGDKYIPKPKPVVLVEEVKQTVVEKPVTKMEDVVQLQLLKQIDATLKKLLLIEERRDARKKEHDNNQKKKAHRFPFLGG